MFKQRSHQRKLFPRFLPALLLLLTLAFLPSFLGAEEPTLSYKELRRYRSEQNQLRLEFNIVSQGLSPNTLLKLEHKSLDDKVHKVKAIFSVLEDGTIGYRGQPQLLTLNDFSVGESMLYTLTTVDGKRSFSLRVVPHPFEKKDHKGHKIIVRPADPEATLFSFSIEGFEPHEKVTVNSQSENEQMTYDLELSDQGDLLTFISPGVKGKRSGTASLEVIGKDAILKLVYLWGKLVKAGSPEDTFSNQ